MQYRPDIVTSDRSGAPTAIVEVKVLSGADVQTATRYLRNLLSHGVVPHTRYVLLITSDMGYLWSSPDEVLHESSPSLTFPMDGVVRHYLPAGNGLTPVGDLVLEPIVRLWLWDLADGIEVDDRVTSSLREAGFLDAIRDGFVNAQAPV